MDMNKMTEKTLNLTWEILNLLTIEQYTVMKNTSEECVTSFICREWSRSQCPIMEPPYNYLIPKRNNDQRILDLTNKMIELLTGETPTVYVAHTHWHQETGLWSRDT
ncbi:uncharacterized protein ACNLHF_020694 isoform 2-T3 [Anomaloglossus baeobatrachus]|uniref:uncharacterized protein LOC142311255 isoform X2 n=1 Tax=Anomaloglossus baeobatrachus TaxID=238106 RepID=UPI003F4FEE30